MCAGVGAGTGFRWLAANPRRARLALAMGTARILQFPLEPTQPLLGEGTGIGVASSLQQLQECAGEQFGGTTIGIGFQCVPVSVGEAQVFMQVLSQGSGLRGPVGGACRHRAAEPGDQPPYPAG